MIEQIKLFDGNTIALEVIDGFTETDEKLAQKLFQEKLDQGFTQIHVLIKLDEMKINHSSIKAFFEDAIWGLRNYAKLGHLAIVAHSNVLKALVPIDNLFFQRAAKGRYEMYFDASNMDDAWTFVGPTE